MTTEPELTRAVESLASTYGEAARLLVVAERERVLGIFEQHVAEMEKTPCGGYIEAQLLRDLVRRIRDGEPRGGAGEPQATGED